MSSNRITTTFKSPLEGKLMTERDREEDPQRYNRDDSGGKQRKKLGPSEKDAIATNQKDRKPLRFSVPVRAID